MGEVRVYGAPSEMAGKWIREADHDAALRRAKADTWMEAAKVCNEWHKIDRTHIKTVADMAEELGRRFDARAAQIEDGEST